MNKSLHLVEEFKECVESHIQLEVNMVGAVDSEQIYHIKCAVFEWFSEVVYKNNSESEFGCRYSFELLFEEHQTLMDLPFREIVRHPSLD